MDKLHTAFETACMLNERDISRGDKPGTQAIVFRNGEPFIYNFQINKKNKEDLQLSLKANVIKSGAEGYIVIFDSIASSGKIKGECCMRTLYTPTEKIMSLIWYEGNQITHKEIHEGRGMMCDKFDAWNAGNIEVLKRVKNEKRL